MFKSAIIGVSGGRAAGLAEAYSHVQRGQLVAISARTPDKLQAFGQRFGIAARYADYRQMLERERPDLVHVNTPPDVRLQVFETAEACGIPAVLVEKPVAIAGEDWRALNAFALKAKTKIAINHQLHFHPCRQRLQDMVASGQLGEVRFIEASCGMNMAYQGTHSLQAIGAFHPSGVPVRVLAQVAGGDGLRDTPRKHLAPDHCTAAIEFADGLRAQLVSGPFAPRAIEDERTNVHKRIAVYGTRGYAHWSMWSWEVGIDGQIKRGTHIYGEEDILGQAAMTEAMFDWIDDARVHPLNLDRALRDFNLQLGIYTSALERRPVDVPFSPGDRLIEQLRDALR